MSLDSIGALKFNLKRFLPWCDSQSGGGLCTLHAFASRQSFKVRLARFSLNPKGIPAQSPRLPRSGYLGSTCHQQFQPQRGCGQRRPRPGKRKGRSRVAVDDLALDQVPSQQTFLTLSPLYLDLHSRQSLVFSCKLTAQKKLNQSF